jgi:hypothetical protein
MQLTWRDLDLQPDFESFRHGMQARTDSGQLAPLTQRGRRRFGELPRVGRRLASLATLHPMAICAYTFFGRLRKSD